jgi:hypothetical protein
MIAKGDPRVSLPPDHRPLREWWRGTYPHVFIAPHPFTRLRVDAPGVPPEVPRDPSGRFVSDRREGGWELENAFKNGAEVMSWRDARRTIAPASELRAFARATWLLSCYGFSQRNDVDRKLQHVIHEWCVANEWFLPDDDSLPPALEPAVGTFLRALGVETVTIRDEFDDHRRDVAVTAFDKGQPVLSFPEFRTRPFVYGVFVMVPGAFLGWEFDGAEAIIGLTDEARERVDPGDHFECFPVDEAARSDWLNPPDFWAKPPSR